ncbi:MAG: hypothetical protein IPL98_12160 [Saprospiraceae bacterium]|jgi:hypothetical protein|nr:hypothetical protein [Saprospiraceae bacterium]
MKNLLSIIAFVVLYSNLFAGGGGGSMFPIFTGMNATRPSYPCNSGWTSSTACAASCGVPLTTAASACPAGTCTNPGYFSAYYETFVFKNTDLNPQCITINWAAVTNAGCDISFAYVGNGPVLFWTPTAAPCYPAGTMGSYGPACVSTGATYSLEVPGCTDFTVFIGNNNGGRGSFNLRLTKGGGEANVGCSGAECIKTLTIGGTQVPTMTQWGLFLFGLIVLTLGVVAVFNMSRKSSNETAR